MLKHAKADAPQNDQGQIIQLLERALTLARAGKVLGIGLIVAAADGNLNVDCVTGRDSTALIVGAAQMQRQLLEGLFPTAK